MRLLVIEDDKQILEAIMLAMEICWPDVQIIATELGEKGVEMVETQKPDAVILDLGLPDISGFDALKEVRRFSDVPVLILTARSEEADIVKGLELGADEYITKPFRQLELMARIRALIRRRTPSDAEAPLTWGNLRFDPASRLLTQGEKVLGLTRTESTILHHLMKRAGQVASNSQLAESIWGADYPDATDSLKVYIRRLRQKVEDDPAHPKIILNKPGLGYFLAKPE